MPQQEDRKTKGLVCTPVQAICGCVVPVCTGGVCVGMRVCLCDSVKADALHAQYCSTKVLNLINVFREISCDIYMNTQICSVVTEAMPPGEGEGEHEEK